MRVFRWPLWIFLSLCLCAPVQAAGKAFDINALNADLKKHRAVLQKDKKNEASRRVLAEIAVAFVLQAETLNAAARPELASKLLTRVKTELPDTLWRIGYMGRQGSGRAQLALGLMYKYGVLAKKDAAKACELFMQAKEHELPAAKYHAALCLTKKDPEQSLLLIRQAAEGGHAEAQELLAHGCMKADPPDTECVQQWATQASDQGRPNAASLLGWLYSSGAGGERDPQKAMTYYERAARAGDVAAQNNLGQLYETGASGKKDLRQAKHWYEQAANKNFGPAQFNLGRVYAAGGDGVKKNNARARQWLLKAEAQGIKEARTVLDWMDKQ